MFFLFFVFLVYRRTHFTVCSEGNLSSVRILFLCLPTTWKSSIALISIIHLSGFCADQPQGLTVSVLDKADRFILLVSRFLFRYHFYAFLKGCVLSVDMSVSPGRVGAACITAVKGEVCLGIKNGSPACLLDSVATGFLFWVSLRKVSSCSSLEAKTKQPQWFSREILSANQIFFLSHTSTLVKGMWNDCVPVGWEIWKVA